MLLQLTAAYPDGTQQVLNRWSATHEQVPDGSPAREKAEELAREYREQTGKNVVAWMIFDPAGSFPSLPAIYRVGETEHDPIVTIRYESVERKHATRTERWAFTEDEIQCPFNAKRDDMLMAFYRSTDRNDRHGIFVNRCGQVTNIYLDGATDVSRNDIGRLDLDNLYTDDQTGEIKPADTWRHVFTNREGEFIGFV